MKKRIVSMILALSMMLSILPVSAFADAGAGFSSAAAEETNSITYSSEEEHEAVGKNSETNNQVVKIKIGTNGLPKAAAGTGWSFDETTGLTITGTGSEDTEYILDGTVSCNVTVKNANSYTVYLLDGTVTGTLLIEADNMYGVYVLGGSYADVQLNLGTIDGGTYDKLTENGGNVRGGFFRDISGLSASTQQQAHQLLLPEGCTLNGQKETKIYIIKKYNYSGDGNNLELAVESDTGCEVWAVASTGGSVMALPAGTQNYAFTYFGSTIATISISADGKTLSASFNMIPAQDDAPMKLVPMVLGATELRFNNEGQPDLTDVTHVDSLDTDTKLRRVYMGNGWAYNCYPNDSSNESILQILDQGGANFDFSLLSDVPINCYVEITNANITGGEFGKNGRLNIYSGKISDGTFHNVSAGINSINGNSAVEITGGTFDSLYCNGSCSITNAVIQSCNFNTYGNNTYTVSNTVLGELPDGIQNLLADGQQLSTLVVRNGNVTAMNGSTLPLSTNTIYLVGAGSAELTLNTDVLSINEAPVSSYNANTSADGKVLRITGNNDGAEIFVNKSTDPSDLKPLRITEEGLPDLTGVTGVPVSGEGMTANLYEGLGWKYATTKENGRTRTALYITTPDGNPVDLTSDTINPYHKAIAVEQITFANVTVTGIVADGSVGMENTIIQDGTFQKDVYMDENSTIAGGSFYDVVRAYGTITGGSFIAEVQLNKNSEVTGGVFHDVQLPNYASEATVIRNAVILGSLKTDSDSKAAISNTVSCGFIESRFLAAGQQQSKLMMTDGTVERLNDYAAATDAVYLIGNVKAEIRFSNAVTNINGAEASDYNEGTSAIDRSLTITAKNDGEPIVVNVAATGKLPFSSLSKSDFTVSGTIEHQTVTSSKEGVGELSLVYVRTYDNAEFATYPAANDLYGVYKQRIVAKEGDKYTEGSLEIGEVVRRYQPKRTDFAYDPKTQTANYTGKMYFEDAPHYSIQYVTEDGSSASVTKPTKAGTYSVNIVVDYSDHYYGTQYEVDTYTVTDSEKLPFSSLKESNFKLEGTIEDPIITCDQEGVGELSLVSVRTDNNAELDHFPSQTEYGSYKVYIEATEGERYTAGRVLVAEEPVVRKYRPTIGNFSFDFDAGTATYTGPKYYGNAVPKADLVYNTTNDDSTATATVPTEAGTYYVWLAVEYDDYYDGSRDYVDSYTVAEKLPFEGFTLDDFDINANEDGTFTLTSPEGVGKSTLEFKCITGVNKGKIFINEIPNAYGRYQGTIVAEEGKKYKAGSIVIGEDSIRYTPEAKDFTYDAAKNKVKYTGTNYYDADPKMTLLYGTDQSETAPTAPGSYDVYVKVTAGKNYIADAHSEVDYRIYQVGTYVVPEPTKPKYYWNGQEGMEQNVGDKITLGAEKREGYTITWKVEGLAKDAYTITDTGTHIEIQFTMPANDVRLKSVYEPISYTLTVDGKDEQRDFDEKVTLTAPEKDGYTFTGWEVTGLPADVDTTKATISFKMPANNVTLKPQYEKNTYTLIVDGVDEPRVFDENVTVTAPEKDGFTFTGWEVTGLPDDVDTTKATISFTMPANNVTLKAQYTENAPKTYKLDVSDATITLKDGSDVADLTAVRVDTELVATAPEKDGYTFTGWEVTGLPADVDTTKATITFKMPANNVTLKPQYEKNTYTLTVDGVDEPRVFDENVMVTAPEKDGYTFTGWEVTGLSADVDTTKATISFKMPANNVTLKPQYEKNTYTLTVDGVDEPRVFDENVTVTAPEKDGYTFTGWEVDGVPEGTDTTSETISFKMPANNVTLKPQYEKNTYTLTVNGKPEQRTVGEEVTLTARKPEGMTFKKWEIKKGLAADAVDINSETITFTMPANDVEISAIYDKVPTPDPDPETKTYKLEVKNAQIFLKDGSAVADLEAVPVDTELKAIAYADTETEVFKCWTGLELTEEQSTARVVYFTMPDHDVNLMAVFVTPTNKLDVSDAKVTLKDGSDVTDLTAVPVGTELVATAPEKDGYTFTGWEVTGLSADVDTTKATITFKMPANNVKLEPQYEKNTYTLTVDGVDEPRVFDENVTVTAPEKDGHTFTGWEVTGLPADVDTTKATISFKMPANNVTLKAQYTENAPKTYKLDVSDATITLKDGGAVADLKAVPAGTELKATADEDTETSVFKSWSCTGLELTEEQRIARVVEFTMPDHDVELTAVFEVPATPDPDPTPAPSDDGGGAVIVAVAAVGGAAIGVGAYIAGTTAYLKSVLPEGMAIPANRQQLAVALWTAAGKPATQSTALFNDVAADAAELQAIRWVVETGLMTAQDGNFKPGSRVGRMEVIRTWKAYQQRG